MSPRASNVASRAKNMPTASTPASANSPGPPRVAPDRSPISQNSMPRTCASGAVVEDQHDERAPTGRDDDAGQQQSRRRPRAVAARQAEHDARSRSARRRMPRASPARLRRPAGRPARRMRRRRTVRARRDRPADCAAGPASSCPPAPAARRRRTRPSRAAGAIRARQRRPASSAGENSARATAAIADVDAARRQRERERRQRRQGEYRENDPVAESGAMGSGQQAMDGGQRPDYRRPIINAPHQRIGPA